MMNEHNNHILNQIKGKLIVSCQAHYGEALHGSFIMGRMAIAAKMGGASGIRSNSPEDIKEIKTQVDLPVIGIYKKVYGDNPVFITPTIQEIDALMACRPEIIATDGTCRERPNGISLDDFYKSLRKKYPYQLFMADISTYEEGLRAAELGFDLVGTTLFGYTDYTKGGVLPGIDLVGKLSEKLDIPVIAEGGIHYPEQLKQVFSAGAFAAVVGGAITRPKEITERFVNAIN